MKSSMLNCDYYEQIFDAFKLNRPGDAKHAVGYRPRGDHKIRVELDDGSYVDYTYIVGYGEYIRDRPKTKESITRSYVHNDFATKLRNMMDRRGVNQLMLAERTGLSQGIISGYLRRNDAYGKDAQKQPINPSIDKVYLIAWALDCDPYELM